MSWLSGTEFWTAFGSIGAFVVIAVSALLALVQLRHMRAGNELEALLAVQRTFQDPPLQEALRYVQFDLPERMRDPAYRATLEQIGFVDQRMHPEMVAYNWFTDVGTLVKNGLLSERLLLDLFARLVNDVDGTLYGTTRDGGTSDKGTVYSIRTDGTEKVLYSFGGGSDGAYPGEGLTDVRGTLYGTTDEGGTSDKGTVYSVTFYGTEKVLHSFGGGSDGDGPFAGLIDVNGTLYGTTFLGGDHGCYQSGCGTVYSISTDGTEKVLYRFDGYDGAQPEARLLHHNGTLYGTTSTGGTYDRGAVYALAL